MDLLQQYNKKIIDWDKAEEYIWYPNRLMSQGDLSTANEEALLKIYKKEEQLWCIKDEDDRLLECVNNFGDEPWINLTLKEKDSDKAYTLYGKCSVGNGYIIMNNPAAHDTMILSSLTWDATSSHTVTNISSSGFRMVNADTGVAMSLDASGYLTVNGQGIMIGGDAPEPIRAGTITSGTVSGNVVMSIDGQVIGEVQSFSYQPEDNGYETSSERYSHDTRPGVSGGGMMQIWNPEPVTLHLDTSQMTQEQIDRLAADLVEYSAPLRPTILSSEERPEMTNEETV